VSDPLLHVNGVIGLGHHRLRFHPKKSQRYTQEAKKAKLKRSKAGMQPREPRELYVSHAKFQNLKHDDFIRQ